MPVITGTSAGPSWSGHKPGRAGVQASAQPFGCNASNEDTIMSRKKPTIRPGQKVPDSGIYQQTGSNRRSTLVEGEPAPPTSEKGKKWRQVVDTNPKN